MVFAVESYGAPRFAIPFETGYPDRLTVDPAGRMFLSDYLFQVVRKFNLEGTPVWAEDVEFPPNAIAATPDHGVLVAGVISSVIQVGSTTIDPQGRRRAVLIKLGP